MERQIQIEHISRRSRNYKRGRNVHRNQINLQSIRWVSWASCDVKSKHIKRRDWHVKNLNPDGLWRIKQPSLELWWTLQKQLFNDDGVNALVQEDLLRKEPLKKVPTSVTAHALLGKGMKIGLQGAKSLN